MIRVENLRKRFGSHEVLRGVTLDVQRGQTAVLIGASGGGKSTVLRCLNALESFDEGRVSVGDLVLHPGPHDSSRAPLHRQLRRRVGMVFQQFNLFPHMSVLENVCCGPLFVQGMPRQEAVARAERLLERVGLRHKRDARPATLSGGQQQRVAIARTLANDPDVVLFDEPTSALDPRMTAEVLAVMSDLSSDGLTMVVVSHAMGFARKSADCVYVLVEGRVMESGAPDQVFDNPTCPDTREFLAHALT